MNVLISGLQFLGYILVFPGFLFCFVCGMLLCGIDRKLVARMQKRIGPPILQPFYDFFKLCGKETIVPETASKIIFLVSPLVGLAGITVIQLFIPIKGFAAVSSSADIIVILYLLLIPALSTITGGAASGSPYASVGVSREMVMIISCELPLILVLLSVGKVVGAAMGTGVTFSMKAISEYQRMFGNLILRPSMVPAAIAFLMTIPGETGSHPFDSAEAETEICEGILAEYSGPPLAVYKLTHGIKIFTMTSLFCALFLGALGTGIVAVDALIVFAMSIVIVFFTVSLPHAVTARLKINQIFKFYWTAVSAIAAIGLIMAWYGL